jgi:hypothetical protein
LQGASAAALLSVIPRKSNAGPTHPVASSSPRPAADKSKSFPEKFLWGCATAGAQVEGNNTTSDLWALEHIPDGMFKEPSGDACDH